MEQEKSYFFGKMAAYPLLWFKSGYLFLLNCNGFSDVLMVPLIALDRVLSSLSE